MAKAGIIAVIYNQKHNLKPFFESLKLQSFKDFTVYFIDNNSVDGSYDYAKILNEDQILDIRYIKQSQNTGYAGGNNTGAKEAARSGCEYLFILNNDMILEKNCFSELVKLMESSSSTACCSPLVIYHNQPEIIQEFGGKVNFRFGTVEKFYALKNINSIRLPEILETDFFCGGAVLIKTSVFMKAGMFEEAYFGYFDEIDLSKRIISTGGGKMYSVAGAVVWHNHIWNPKNKKGYYLEYYLMQRNKYLYFRKYKLVSSLFISFFIDIIKFPVRLLWFKKVCDLKVGYYYVKGTLDGIINRKGKPGLL